MEIEKISKLVQEQILRSKTITDAKNDKIESFIIILPHLKEHFEEQIPACIQCDKIHSGDKDEKLKRIVFGELLNE